MSSRDPLPAPTPEPLWPRWLPDIAWGPIISGALILIAGILGFAFREPWLFSSLGPTAFIVVETPRHPSAKIYNVLVGHFSGILCGVIATWITGAAAVPPVSRLSYPDSARIWAAGIAVGLTMFVVLLLRASHPPAAATTLLFALGEIKPNWKGVVSVIAGVVILAAFSEGVRLSRMGRKPELKDFIPGQIDRQ